MIRIDVLLQFVFFLLGLETRGYDGYRLNLNTRIKQLRRNK